MPLAPNYYIPIEKGHAEIEEKKSKFITTLTGVTSKEEAISFCRQIKEQHPGANHNCHAYIIGNPSSPKEIGFSDDGEPSGTAGKPILSVLTHNNIGNVAVVVTRFFGGTKLGTGGLVRAYSSAVKMVLNNTPLEKFTPSSLVQISIPFRHESTIRNILARKKLTIIDSEYSEDVFLEVMVPDEIWENLAEQIKNVTQGDAKFKL